MSRDLRRRIELSVSVALLSAVLAACRLPWHGQRVQRPQAQTRGRIEQFRVEHGVYDQNGAKGIRIHVRFWVEHGGGRPIKLIAYFHWGSGERLVDADGAYRAADGQVCAASGTLIPRSDMSLWSDYSLFMPYRQLHIGSPGRHRLKFDVWLWDLSAARGRMLDRTAWHEFWFDLK